MASDRFLDVSPHGIFASHPERIDLPVLVAPSESGKFNTIRYPLIAVACAQLPDGKFEFDSSFIISDVAESMGKLASLVKAHPGCPLSLFGHTDPVGDDAYNKKLSGRRAMAVYGMLIRNEEIWEDIYSNTGIWTAPLQSDHWGDKAIQQMLNLVLAPDGISYYIGPIDGKPHPEYQDALVRWRKDNNVTAGPVSRKKLYRRYMDEVCRDDKTGQPFSLTKEDFLARGAGDKAKGDVQGCSEFNPILLFSQEDEAEFKKLEQKDQRNAANRPNRRVLTFLFRKGTVIDPTKWPCPKAKDGDAGCRDRFWSDAKVRRDTRLPGEPREFSKTEDTFACRFYHGFAVGSPCEDKVKLWILRLLVAGPNGTTKPVANRNFVVTVGEAEDAAAVRGVTDNTGMLQIPVMDDHAVMTLKVDAWDALITKPAAASGSGKAPASKGDGASSTGSDTPGQAELADEKRFMVLTLKAGDLTKMEGGGDPAAKQRLYNLGFGRGDIATWTQQQFQNYLKAFQKENSLADQSGTLTPETRDRLKLNHGS